MSDVTKTLAERGTRYGDFSDNARVAQRLKMALAEGVSWGSLSHDQCEALEVISQKMSRIVTGDPDYADNWHDIQGYAKLVEDRLLADQTKPAVKAKR